MNMILISVLTVTVIGVVCAVILAIASQVMAVKTDERLPMIREILPGVNCGACGYAGCDGYAAALLNAEAKVNRCTPGGDAVAHQLSAALGLRFEDVIEKVAVVRCVGTTQAAAALADYQGLSSCAAAALLHGGNGLCPTGCLGFGDCANVCPSDAIEMEDGIARVVYQRCTGCGLCVAACPKGIISTEADEIQVAVACSNCEKAAAARRACKNGCIACKRCERVCPEQAIVVTDDLAVIDYARCTGCGRCVEVCPVHCIIADDFRGVSKRG